ncbi:hypothetical protein HDU83_006645 [Entophlyctis luteolus]|nr:hypothetical protein HDU83_006645 [Entophlyctis luteolus]
MAPTLAIDIVAGFATSFLVSPSKAYPHPDSFLTVKPQVVAIIDSSIIANASGREPLKQGLYNGFHMLMTNPHKFLRNRTFFPIFCIFGGTYSVANVAETVSLSANVQPDFWRFSTSSAVNITLCSWKDQLFTKWFGVVAPKPIPKLSYCLFGIRDSMTVGTSLILPPKVSPYLQREPFNMSKGLADFTCQMSLPCLVQLVSTPIHLLSLDLYNHERSTFAARLAKIRKDYYGSAVGRICRTLPGFGFGGISNRGLRSFLNERIGK